MSSPTAIFRNTNIILSAGSNDVTYDPARCNFTKRFPMPFNSKGSRIGLLSGSLYYSWDNLTSKFNNLTGCKYIFNGVTYSVVYPTGSYSIAQLNAFLQFTMKANGHYLLDDNGSPVYFLTFITNLVYYTVTLTVTPIPAVLPTGWTNPMAIALSGNTPQLVVDPNTRWGLLIGYAGGTYPMVPQVAQWQCNGTLVPRISDVTSVMVLCDWVNDGRFGSNESVIASFVPDAPYGSLLSYKPLTVTTYDAIERTYMGIGIRFVDQDGNALQIKDNSQTSLTLLLEEPVSTTK